MDAIIERISKLIKERKMTANSLCAELGIYKGAVTEWKNGKVKPSAEILIGISRIFNISLDWLMLGEDKVINLNDLAQYELQLLKYFRQLPENEKYRTLGNIEAKVEIYQESKKEMPILRKMFFEEKKEPFLVETETQYKEMNIAQGNFLAAGAGEILQEENFDKITFPEIEVPENADFGVYVSGDSMEPEYFHGEIAWVKSTIFINYGEVIALAVNNNSYIKQYRDSGLISFNPKYPPIVINENDYTHLFGKVVGKTSHHIK